MKREDFKGFQFIRRGRAKIMDLHGADIEKQRAVGLREVVQPGFELAGSFPFLGVDEKVLESAAHLPGVHTTLMCR